MARKKQPMVIIDETDPKDLTDVKRVWNAQLLNLFLNDRKAQGYDELESLNTLQKAISG